MSILETSGVGRRIVSLRKTKGWTQENLAETAGVHRSYLAEVELGTKQPSIDMLVAISSCTNVTIDWLLLGKGEMFRGEGSPKDEEALLDKYRRLSPEDRTRFQAIFDVVAATVSKNVRKYSKKSKGKSS